MLNGRSGWFLGDDMIVAADKVSPSFQMFRDEKNVE